MLDLNAAKSIEINGTALATFENGEGVPLVFVHGSASDARTWSHQFDTFSRRFRTIAYSRRFHKPNFPIPDDAPDPIQTHVDDLASLLRTLDACPAHVVGHSWGGLVDLLLARQFPELVRSLTLIEPPAISLHVSIPPKPLELMRLLISSPQLALAIMKFGGGTVAPAEKAFRHGDEERAVEIFARGVLGNRYYKNLSTERRAQVWENRGPDRALALHHGFPDLKVFPFSEIRIPVLLIAGTDSPTIFRLLAENLHGRFPDAQMKLIENASHVAQENAPDALNKVIEEFLEYVE
ncbi:alpha/beta fold hydrolase [Sedimentitalea sp. HM32M-2]|uniref:alpha/beta fold hydrolase n=1 Tax=Sedimentitalea sp. HM32M-2 TaxID=3351566 RepID=UPI00362D2952